MFISIQGKGVFWCTL